MQVKNTSLELLEKLTSSWEDNGLSDFLKLFHRNAKIYHPYFKIPITPLDAMEVMNTAVSGTTQIEKIELKSGDGSGKRDKVHIEIIDSGELVPDISYVGVMCMEFEIKKHKISKIRILGGKTKKIKERQEKFDRRIEKRTSIELAQTIANFWGSNMSSEYLGLFTEKALIKHVLFSEPFEPEVVIDIMHCNVKGTTELYGYDVIQGSGHGENDILELKFIETGDLIGYEPSKRGVMNVRVNVKNCQVDYLEAYGYDIVEI